MYMLIRIELLGLAQFFEYLNAIPEWLLNSAEFL